MAPDAVTAPGRDFPTHFSADERLVLELADAMTRDIEVPDATDGTGCARASTRAASLEVVATVAAYNMVSRFLVALRIQHP